MLRFCVSLAFLALTTWVYAANPFDPNDSDFSKWGPKLVQDELLPSEAEVLQVHQWADFVFGGSALEPSRDGSGDFNDFNPIRISVLHQSHARLRFNESCMGHPMKIGKTEYRSGLGTHARSEIQLEFTEPVVEVSAAVGIDCYSLGQVGQGSVEFTVSTGGKELFRSPVKKGGEDATEIRVKFQKPVQAVILGVDPTQDGETCDQANWADLRFVGVSGIVYEPGNRQRVPLALPLGEFGKFPLYTSSSRAQNVPFSFNYGGVSSREFLDQWKYESKKTDDLHVVHSWTDPQTGLTVSATVRLFQKFAAVDWVLNFKNAGTKTTPMISDVRVLDAPFALGLENESVAIHTLLGDSCSERSWLPTEIPLKQGKEPARFAPNGGRPSNGSFPFWNLVRSEVPDGELTEGIFFCLGWSGQWNAEFAKPDFFTTTAQAGMEQIATVLLPGEKIRSPRVLLMPWRTDRLAAHALFRRLLMFEYAPKEASGFPQQIGLIGQCFDRYYRKRAGWEKFDGQVEFARRLKAAGCTRYWFDAAWFPVGFPNGVGNWFSDDENFPNGLEALGDEIQKLGLSFVLWFEPERVAPGTWIDREFPQYVFKKTSKDSVGPFTGNGLFKLNDPEARRFLTDLLSKRIDEYKIGVYRNDFNIDPLAFWRANDEPDRVGMTEIRYVEGHYEMWNELRRRHPGLWIDNCASGGRRIDLETTSMAIPLWRSDTCCWPGHPEWDQNQTIGVAQYLPLFSAAAWDASPYTFRSTANPGCIMQYNFLDADYDPELTRKSVDEARAYQKFWYGDFYPLTGVSTDQRGIVAWQLHRPDLNAGLIYAFRQPKSPYLGISLDLHAIDPAAKYLLTIKNDYESDQKLMLSGTEFLVYQLLIPEKKSCVVIEYQKE